MNARTLSIALAATLATACGPALLADTGAAVGEPCSAPPTGTLSSSPGDDLRFWFGDQGQVYMRSGGSVSPIGSCDTGVQGDGGRGFRIDHATIGEHSIARTSGPASISNAVSGEYASSGSIEITGYDPATGSLCGTFTAVYEARVESGTFAAKRLCE